MRSVGLEHSTTSFALTTHQVTNLKYDDLADEAENRVSETLESESSRPEASGNGEREVKNRRPTPQGRRPGLGDRLDLMA